MYLVLCEDEPEFAEELGRELKGFFEKKKWSVKSADGSGYEEDTEPTKTKKQYYMTVGAVFVVMLLLNGVLFYSSKCSGEYLQSENVWGVSQYVKASDYSKRRLLIEELPENPEQAMEKLRATSKCRPFCRSFKKLSTMYPPTSSRIKFVRLNFNAVIIPRFSPSTGTTSASFA